ncbi:MAG TPA: hypothetical protein ENN17_04035 [bacterium]|nr:hypothetical protein [bacterium]
MTANAYSVQSELESLMAESGNEGRWERMALFSGEGLLMAAAGDSPAVSQERLLEFAFAQIETVRMLEPVTDGTEITLRVPDDRLLVFRFFKAWDETLVLAAVANRRKGYRRAMGRIVARIRKMV